MGQEITVRVVEGKPEIALKSGHPLRTSYLGTPTAVSALEQNSAQGLSLASADFDNDGVLDLAAGYATSSGGIVVLHRGNIDSIYPNNPAAQERRQNGTFTDSPFLAPALVFDLPVPVEFLAAGDFDADNNFDVVASSSTDSALYWMRGNGKLELNAPKRIPLSGRPIALVAGEMNRQDSFVDLVIAVNSPDGPQVLVFDGAKKSLNSRPPEVFMLSGQPTAVALGQLDKDHYHDLAVAAGNELTIIHGRNDQHETALISRITLPFETAGLAIGNFLEDDDHRKEFAVLSADGRIQILERVKRTDLWRAAHEMTTVQGRSTIIKAKVSTYPSDDLSVFGPSGVQLANREFLSTSPIETAGETKAILPMRLNSHALHSLVMLENSQSVPSIIPAAANATFIVSNTNDNGVGSFKEAIKQANKNPGLDEIQFQIGTGPQALVLNKNLPAIKDSVTIDATTQIGFAGEPVIELNGGSLLKGNGIKVIASSSVIRGFVINDFPRAGFLLKDFGNNIIEGNYIGTDLSGIFSAGNLNGIVIKNSNADVIGCAIAGTRSLNLLSCSNIISGNLISAVRGKNVESTIVNSNSIGRNVQGDPLSNAGNITILFERFKDIAVLVNQIFSNHTASSLKNGSDATVQDNSFEGGLKSGEVVRIIAVNYSRNSMLNTQTGVSVDASSREVSILNNQYSHVPKPILNPFNSNLLSFSNVLPTSVRVTITGGVPNSTYVIEANYTGGSDYLPDVTPIDQITLETDGLGDGEVVTIHPVQPSGFLTGTSLCVSSSLSQSAASAIFCPGNTSEFVMPVPIDDGSNTPPQISGLPAFLLMDEGVQTNTSFSVIDVNNDPVTVTGTGMPAGVTINQINGNTWEIAGIPGFDTAGDYSIEVTASDGINPDVQATVPTTVNNVNRPPAFITAPTTLFNVVGDSPIVNIRVEDPDGDAITLDMEDLPPGMAFNQIDANTWRITGTLTTAGTFNVVLTATDGNSTTPFIFTWVVDPAGQTFIVINTNDSGIGSLRQAMLDAINSGLLSTILFNIPGTPPHTINLSSPLPVIATSMEILGSSQPGSNGTPPIEINGFNAGLLSSGFVFNGGSGTIEGLTINRFAGNGIGGLFTGTTIISNNFIGTNAAGTAALSNGTGINGQIADGANVEISNNLVSGNGAGGIVISSGVSPDNLEISNNTVGLNSAGTAPIGNGFQGLLLQDTQAGNISNNVISGNLGSGVMVVGSSNLTLQNNLIGTNLIGGILGNSGSGIFLINSGDIELINNTYANNFKGVVATGDTGTTGIAITGGVFQNQTDINVDNGDDGPDSNDFQDTDTGPNSRQNSADVVNATQTMATVVLNSTPNTTFTIVVYRIVDGIMTALATKIVGTNGNGDVGTTIPFALPQDSGTQLVSRVLGPNGTSEFSPPFTIP
jgi:parallel beta-helix repeat protein